MKLKKITFISLLLMTVLSCSKSDQKQEYVDESAVKVDYGANFNNSIYVSSRLEDLTIYNDNSLGILYSINNSLYFKKFSSTGSETNTFTLPNEYGSTNGAGITNSISGETLFVDENSVVGNKIYTLGNNYSQVNTAYTMLPIVSTYFNIAKLRKIRNFGDDTYFAFDSNSITFKKYSPISNSENFILGGQLGIIDGVGPNAGFVGPKSMVIQNNIIYILDGNSIRKIENKSLGWTVNTLYTFATQDFVKGIAIDSQNTLYVLKREGIFSLNLTTNVLTPYKTSDINIRYPDNKYTTIQINFLDNIYIKNADLYLVNSNSITKISDFKSKL